MISYELCKQLQDAGLPGYNMHVGLKFEGKSDFFRPTLSQLIEECGDKVVLHSPGSKDVNEEYWMPAEYEWSAFKQFEDKDTVCQVGRTPEEAVAKLWLELNNK